MRFVVCTDSVSACKLTEPNGWDDIVSEGFIHFSIDLGCPYGRFTPSDKFFRHHTTLSIDNISVHAYTICILTIFNMHIV